MLEIIKKIINKYKDFVLETDLKAAEVAEKKRKTKSAKEVFDKLDKMDST